MGLMLVPWETKNEGEETRALGSLSLSKRPIQGISKAVSACTGPYDWWSEAP